MVFDCHSDLFTDVTVKMLKGEKNIIKNHHLKNLQKGGLIGGIYVIWIDPPYDKCPEDRAKQIVTALTEEIKNNTDIINQVKDFSDFEKEKSREILKYSIKTTIFIFIFLILFVISPLFFEMGSLYIFTSILFPASIIFYFTIYIVGYTEIKKGRNFIYPFI